MHVSTARCQIAKVSLNVLPQAKALYGSGELLLDSLRRRLATHLTSPLVASRPQVHTLDIKL